MACALFVATRPLTAVYDVYIVCVDCERCSTAWSTVSIGFESQDGNRGQQIEYGDIPPDSTQFFIPAECHTYDANIHH